MNRYWLVGVSFVVFGCSTRIEWRTLPAEVASGASGVCVTDAGDDAAEGSEDGGVGDSALESGGADAADSADAAGSGDASGDSDAGSFDSGDGSSVGDSGGDGAGVDAGSVDGATDGGDGGDSGVGSGDASSVAYIRQTSQISTPGDNKQDQYSQLPMPVLAGSAVLVFVTEYNINGNPAGSGAPSPVTVTDGQGTYTLLATVNDPSDWQAAMAYYRPNVSAGTIDVHAHFAGLEWQGIVVAEIANTTAAPLIAQASSLDNAAQKSANAVKTPSIAVGSTAALIVAFAVNGLDTYGEPSVGTGYMLSLAAWNWGGVEGTATTPSSVLEVETASGSVKGTWTAAGAGDNWLTFVSAWQ